MPIELQAFVRFCRIWMSGARCSIAKYQGPGVEVPVAVKPQKASCFSRLHTVYAPLMF